MKVRQGALLYNKIDCYNKGVQKKVPLAQWKIALTPQNIKDTRSSFSWLRPGIADQLSILLRIMVFLEVEMQGSILIHLTNWYENLHKAVILRWMGSSTTRKSSNEHGFFVIVTSFGKIGEGRIRDLTGDVFFSVTFKGTMSTVTMKNPWHYWCVMTNKALMCISNCADPPHL